MKCGFCHGFDKERNRCRVVKGAIDHTVHFDDECVIPPLIGEQEATIEEQQEEIESLKTQVHFLQTTSQRG